MESTISQLLTRLFWLEMIEVASAIALTTLAMMMYRAAGRRRPRDPVRPRKAKQRSRGLTPGFAAVV